jgi:hypothetical protein
MGVCSYLRGLQPPTRQDLRRARSDELKGLVVPLAGVDVFQNEVYEIL